MARAKKIKRPKPRLSLAARKLDANRDGRITGADFKKTKKKSTMKHKVERIDHAHLS